MPKYPIHGSKHFDCREWVDERTWKLMGEKCACLIDPKIIRIADLIKEKTNRIVMVNTWYYAEPHEVSYKASGFRAPWEKVGGELSQHRAGRAGDFKVRGLSPQDVFALVLANTVSFEEAGLTTIEDISFTPTWLHLDCRPKVPGWHPESGFLIVKP